MKRQERTVHVRTPDVIAVGGVRRPSTPAKVVFNNWTKNFLKEILVRATGKYVRA